MRAGEGGTEEPSADEGELGTSRDDHGGWAGEGSRRLSYCVPEATVWGAVCRQNCALLV